MAPNVAQFGGLTFVVMSSEEQHENLANIPSHLRCSFIRKEEVCSAIVQIRAPGSPLPSVEQGPVNHAQTPVKLPVQLSRSTKSPKNPADQSPPNRCESPNMEPRAPQLPLQEPATILLPLSTDPRPSLMQVAVRPLLHSSQSKQFKKIS
ncbi:hypothetical protein Pelo_107 [Pelomyxa schiedti]|nr:hypothetical protein Pelo_107 [Pelomyxa schiedti]